MNPLMPERGDIIRYEGEESLTVRLTSDGKPYVIRGNREHVVDESESFAYDVASMESAEADHRGEAARLRVKLMQIRTAL